MNVTKAVLQISQMYALDLREVHPQLLCERDGKHSDAIPLFFRITHQYLLVAKVNVFTPKVQAFLSRNPAP